jgi:hypothetical protein
MKTETNSADRMERITKELREMEGGLEPEVICHRIAKYEYEDICRARECLETILASTDDEPVRSSAETILNILDNEWD